MLFRKLLRCVCGMAGPEPVSLLTSLPCELMFNDLRDAGKRHMKREKVAPQNIHAVAVKSVLKRSGGCKSLSLENSDWATPLNHKAVKKTVYSSTRASDVSLGISSEGLTKHKSTLNFSKPHIFCHRLKLLEILKTFWEKQQGEEDDKRAAVIHAHSSMWLSKLIPPRTFFRLKACGEDQPPNPPMLVAKSGPYSILALRLVLDSDLNLYSFPSWNVPKEEILVLDHKDVEICVAALAVAEGSQVFGTMALAWKQSGLYMSLLDYIADFSIIHVNATMLSALCSRLKLRGHSKLDHKHRVQLFLSWMGRSQEYIDEVLCLIPDKPPRKKKHPEDRTFMICIVYLITSLLPSWFSFLNECYQN